MVVRILIVVQKFIDDLEDKIKAKVYKNIDLLKEFGLKLGEPYSKKIGDNLYELRTSGKTEVRLIYSFKDGTSFIVHGFFKKTRKIPLKEIKVTKERKQKLAL